MVDWGIRVNRVVKFRVWDTRGKIMIYPSPHMNPLYLTLAGRLVEIDREGDEVPAPNYILMRCTGLSDMKGCDIYEGDVIQHHKYGGNHVVRWIPESTGFFVGEEAWPLTALCCPNIEVIGNIHDRTNS